MLLLVLAFCAYASMAARVTTVNNDVATVDGDMWAIESGKPSETCPDRSSTVKGCHSSNYSRQEM